MIRFLADASLHDAIVTGCLRREPAIDFLSAHEAGLEGVPDLEVLALATHQGRILVTSDFRTMPRHFGNFLEANGECTGVFLVRGGMVGLGRRRMEESRSGDSSAVAKSRRRVNPLI